jgi:hypothetical protein
LQNPSMVAWLRCSTTGSLKSGSLPLGLVYTLWGGGRQQQQQQRQQQVQQQQQQIQQQHVKVCPKDGVRHVPALTSPCPHHHHHQLSHGFPPPPPPINTHGRSPHPPDQVQVLPAHLHESIQVPFMERTHLQDTAQHDMAQFRCIQLSRQHKLCVSSNPHLWGAFLAQTRWVFSCHTCRHCNCHRGVCVCVSHTVCAESDNMEVKPAQDSQAATQRAEGMQACVDTGHTRGCRVISSRQRKLDSSEVVSGVCTIQSCDKCVWVYLQARREAVCPWPREVCA